MTGRLWLVGCGNMGGAMLRRWLESGMDAASVTVIDPARPDIAPEVRWVADVGEAGVAPDILVLAVKPQLLDAVAPGLADIGPETLVLSILAGVEVASLRARFPNAQAIVRAMPNLPVALGKGVVALHGPADEALRGRATALMAPLGLVEWIEDEGALHLVAALAASGPAFVYRFIDALGAAAARLGLEPAQAARLALATVEGSATLAADAHQTPAELAEAVASKGGMTRKGLDVLDDGEALTTLLVRTVEAAARRSVVMADEAKG